MCLSNVYRVNISLRQKKQLDIVVIDWKPIDSSSEHLADDQGEFPGANHVDQWSVDCVNEDSLSHERYLYTHAWIQTH